MKKSGNVFGWVFFLILLGGRAPHAHPMRRTCGEPNEIELTATRSLFTGSHQAPGSSRGAALSLSLGGISSVGTAAFRSSLAATTVVDGFGTALIQHNTFDGNSAEAHSAMSVTRNYAALALARHAIAPVWPALSCRDSTAVHQLGAHAHGAVGNDRNFQAAVVDGLLLLQRCNWGAVGGGSGYCRAVKMTV